MQKRSSLAIGANGDQITRELLTPLNLTRLRGTRLQSLTAPSDEGLAAQHPLRPPLLAPQLSTVRVDHTQHHMHHKFAIFDGELLLNGSYNWTRSAFKYNHENLLVTTNTTLVQGFSKAFEDMWKEFA